MSQFVVWVQTCSSKTEHRAVHGTWSYYTGETWRSGEEILSLELFNTSLIGQYFAEKRST